MVNQEKCISCGACVNACPVNAISLDKKGKATIDKSICIECGTCQEICPVEAIVIGVEESK